MLSVYQALTEVASNYGTDRFKEYYIVISEMAGVSESTFKRCLLALKRMNLITYQTKRTTGHKYDKCTFELLDVKTVGQKIPKRKNEKPKNGKPKPKKPEVKKYQKDGYLEENITSIEQLVERVENDKLKKTLSTDEIGAVLGGMKKLSRDEVTRISKILNKNQLANVIFEGWVSIAGVEFIEPVKEDRSRQYRQRVKYMQDIVKYLVSENATMNLSDVFLKMTAWSQTGLSWDIATVLKHIEKPPSAILEFGGKKRKVVESEHATKKSYNNDLEI